MVLSTRKVGSYKVFFGNTVFYFNYQKTPTILGFKYRGQKML